MYHIIITFVFLIPFLNGKKSVFYHISFLMLACLFSTRGDMIPDTEMYLRDYETPYVEYIRNSLDPGFWLLDVFFGQMLSISFGQFLFVITFLLMELWFYSARKMLPINRCGICFLLFLSYYGFFYLGITLRNAVSLFISFFAISFLNSESKKRYIVFYFLILVAFLFHRTILLLLLLPMLLKVVKISHRSVCVWLVVDLVMLAIGGLISDMGSGYLASSTGGLDKYEESLTVQEGGHSLLSAWFIMNLVIMFFIIKGRKSIDVAYSNVYNLFFVISMVGLTVNCIGWNLGIIQRLAGTFYFYTFVPLYLVIFHSNLIVGRKKKELVANAISIFCFLVLIYCQSYLLYY